MPPAVHPPALPSVTSPAPLTLATLAALPGTDYLLDESAVSERLKLSRSYLRKARMTPGRGPAFLKINRLIRYSWPDCVRWLAQFRSGNAD